MKWFMRILLYFFGILCITIGINLSILSGLGVSPVSAFIAPLSEALHIKLGTLTTCIYAIFVLIQIGILQKNFKLKNLLQLPFSVIFGMFVDVGGFYMEGIELSTYLSRMVVLLLSILICAIGASIYMTMDIVSNPPEGLLLAICERFTYPFSKVKLCSDCFFVFVGIVISLYSTHSVTLIREGTILATLITGPCIGIVSKKIGTRLNNIAFSKEAKSVL